MRPNGVSEQLNDVGARLKFLQLVSNRRWWVLVLDVEILYRVMDHLRWLLVTLEAVTDLLNNFK